MAWATAVACLLWARGSGRRHRTGVDTAAGRKQALAGHAPEASAKPVMLSGSIRPDVAAPPESCKAVRTDLAQAVPAWPPGPPAWDDPWLALALHTPATT
ncbi:hypothetical protein ACFZCU_27750 [Streptomyces canus]|uniref:hypothetical protein n=1 Tax=Streptomyces canus TaxID=58343 RepID=UPI0036E034F7